MSQKKKCDLSPRGKFVHFIKASIDLDAIFGAAADAGLAQWSNNDKKFGQGMQGYGKRYAAAFTDSASLNFFSKFLYPTLFHEDTRYYALRHGTRTERLGHALRHTFIAQSDTGRSMPNYSLWAGTASTQALGNLYHPGNERGMLPATQWTGISIANDMGMDVLTEFWPEIVRKFRLPFHERRVAFNNSQPR